MSDIKIPLDTPIPTTESMYAWSEADQVWLSWVDYVFRTARRNLLSAREPAASERSSAASLSDAPLLEFEEVS